MKRTLFHLSMIAFTVAIGLAPAAGQDLSQLAKKTREERMKVKQQQSVRVWTNDNIPKAPASEGPTAAAGMSAAPPPSAPGALAAAPPTESADVSDTSEVDALRDQIKQTKQSLKGLETRLSLAEDELNLLQIQLASELSPQTQSALAPKISDKKAEIAALNQQIDKTKKDVEGLEKDLKAKGGTLEEEK